MLLFVNGHESQAARANWTALHDKLSMELGLEHLAPAYTGFYDPKGNWHGLQHSILDRCKTFILAPPTDIASADSWMKDRLSLIELAFRHRGEEIADLNAAFPAELLRAKLDDKLVDTSRGPRFPGSRAEAAQAMNARINQAFLNSINELNTRFRQAAYPLNYHSGFIQLVDDQTTNEQIDQPFWSIISGPDWKNVDTDMKVSVHGGGGNSRREAARRSDRHESGGGALPGRCRAGHRVRQLRWSCDASPRADGAPDDRGQIATGRAAAEGR